MHVPAPDRLVIQALDDYLQLTTTHVRELLFPTAKSQTTCYRVLKRLERDGYVSVINRRRLVGGRAGGSGEHVWELGPAGARLVGREGRWRPHAINYHSLAISDVVIRLRKAERAGEIRVSSLLTEPHCWLTVQGTELRPDLDVVLERPETGARLAAFIEVDLDTERAPRIVEKMTRYLDAYRKATAADLSEYRRIIFVSENEPRRAEIASLVGRLGDDERKYFRSILFNEFPQNMG